MRSVSLSSRDLVRALLASAAVVATAPLQAQGAQEAVSTGLGDIVVTAQRRAENLQDVPVAITAATAETLASARVENISNIQNISPSIQFRVTNISTSSANVMIRGLGTTGNSRSFEGAVGIFIDGVYRTRAAAALQNFVDIDSLQVLRGPQGTLFGKNTSAGAVILTSTAPSLLDTEGNFEIGYGNYDTFTAKGAVSVPLADTAALRVSGLYSKRDGFYTDAQTGNSLNNDETYAFKGQLLVEPADGVSVRLIGDFSRGEGNCCYATSNYIDGPTQPLVDALTQALGLKLPSTKLSDFEQTLNREGNQIIKDYGGTLLVDVEIGGDTLKSVTALREFSVGQYDVDPDFSGADIFTLSESFQSRFFSQELTYNGRIESIDANYVLGAFFSDEKLDMTRDLGWKSQGQAYWDAVLSAQGIPAGALDASEGPTANEVMGGKARSYAGFAHINANLTEQWSVIAGIRYSIEEKSGFFRNSFYRPAPNEVFKALGIQPGPAYSAKQTDRALSGTLGVQYRPTDESMVYLTYNRGFKAGGVNIDANAGGTVANNPALTPGAVPLDPRYAPETVNAFELGAKVDYLDGRARTNVAVFYNDISDLQVAQFVGLQFTVLNAKSASTYGLELENLFQLTDSLTLGLDGTWLPHARYDEDAQLAAVLSDSRFRYAPKFAGNATLNLDQPLDDDLTLNARAQYQFSTSQLIDNASMADRGDVGIVNANLGLKSERLGLHLEAWVQNLFDKTYANVAFATPLQTGDSNAYLAPPRTFGVTLRGRF